MFHPGETVAHTFVLPFAKINIHHVIVSYRQNEQIVLEKIITSKTNLTETGENETTVSIIMTEIESLLFADQTDYIIQVNVYFGHGEEITGHATSDEISGYTGYIIPEYTSYQQIRDIGQVTAKHGIGTLEINDDGELIWTHTTGSELVAIDNDSGFLVIERKLVL